jgi:hypothetical protein
LKPTIGRIVWFRPRADRAPGVEYGGEILPAIVVNVFGDGVTDRVDLQVFTNNHRGIRWEHDVLQGDEPGRWQWPTQQPQEAKR